MPEWFWLVVQAALAIIAIEQMRRRVFASLDAVHHVELIVDVWGPLTLVIPMLFFTASKDNSVSGPAWMVVGGPITCGLFALGAALMSRKQAAQRKNATTTPTRVIVASLGTGALLLLLGAAHDLSLWMGQCAFAIGAVLLWMNTPDVPSHAGPNDVHAADNARAGLGMTVALLCALGQGLAASKVAPAHMSISGAIIVVTAAMMLSAAARLCGSKTALRLGLWGAVYGMLLGLGLLSLNRLMPAAWQILQTGSSGANLNRVASGFGEYALEATLLLAVSGAAIAHHRVPRRMGVSLGAGVIFIAAALAAWRLSES